MITTGTVFLYKYVAYQYTKLKKWKGQSRMDNPEIQATLGTQDIRLRQKKRKQKTRQKTKKISNMNPTKNLR
jgi:hypothetical protein